LPNWLVEEVTTDTAEVEVSGCDIPKALVGDKDPVDALLFVPVPTSEPFADAAELGAPPTLAELREYIEDTDMRFGSISDIDGLERRAGSGSGECFVSSAIVLEANRGVSKSSTAKSSLLDLLLGLALCLQSSGPPDVR
jgi:hypothetical protein